MPGSADHRRGLPPTAPEAGSTVTLADTHPASAGPPPTVAQLDAALTSALAGRFRVERVLGMGASGVVFQAFDREAAESVAIKILYRRDARRLFLLKREFRQLVEIAHPNLVGVHELFVSQSGHAFFTMDLVHDASTFLEFHRPEGRTDAPRSCDRMTVKWRNSKCRRSDGTRGGSRSRTS